MVDTRETPLTTPELIALDEAPCRGEEDGRPWGVTTENAFAFTSTEPIVAERADAENGYVLRSSTPIFPGLLVSSDEVGEVVRRTLAERVEARQLRLRREDVAISPLAPSLDGHRPRGVPIAYLPPVHRAFAEPRVGLSARGGRGDLSTTVVSTQDGDNHTTVIDGESRTFLRPTRYPYTAVCKLELWSARTGLLWSPWLYAGEFATGFLVGRRILMTSGHAFDMPPGMLYAIKVIPACWANASVFGPGMVTWVQQRLRWHGGDMGSDLQVCQLSDRIGDPLGFFGIRNYQAGWEDHAYWTMAGFPYDRSQFAMSVESGITVRDDDDGDDIALGGTVYDTTQIESDADEASGASGSPLFAFFGDGNACAIGVHAGAQHDWTMGGTETWACAAGGDGLHAIVKWARDNWD